MESSSALPLRGSCDCGRNQYLIAMPAELSPSEFPTVLFDASSEYRKQKRPSSIRSNRQKPASSSRLSSSSPSPSSNAKSSSSNESRLTKLISVRSISSPVSVFLRVPLPWLQSTTYAFYPSETHAHIRRSYTPHHAPHSKRYFCGHCATTLTVWSEARPEEAEWVCVNWHSLEPSSREALDEMGILPDIEDEEDEVDDSEKAAAGAEQAGDAAVTVIGAEPPRVERAVVVDEQGKKIRGQPWFEEMLEGSELGRIRRRRGGNTSADGKQTVEWEIIEYEETGGNGGTATPTRRKIDQGADDIAMSGAH